MTEVTEFETRTHWHPNRLRTVEDGLYSEPSVPDVKSLLGQETWLRYGGIVRGYSPSQIA
jgi:hypothetical protein